MTIKDFSETVNFLTKTSNLEDFKITRFLYFDDNYKCLYADNTLVIRPVYSFTYIILIGTYKSKDFNYINRYGVFLGTFNNSYEPIRLYIDGWELYDLNLAANKAKLRKKDKDITVSINKNSYYDCDDATQMMDKIKEAIKESEL